MIIKAAGRTLPELLEDSGRRLFAHLTDPDDVGEALREKISLEASNPTELLKQWMTDLLNLAQVQRILLKACRVTVHEEGGNLRVTAEILGELFDPQRHVFRLVGACESAQVHEEAGKQTAEIKFGEIA